MTNEHEYFCSNCGVETDRDMLTVKKVLFTTMGAGSTTVRSRVIGWLCVECTKKDDHWNLPRKLQPAERPPVHNKALPEEVLNG